MPSSLVNHPPGATSFKLSKYTHSLNTTQYAKITDVTRVESFTRIGVAISITSTTYELTGSAHELNCPHALSEGGHCRLIVIA